MYSSAYFNLRVRPTLHDTTTTRLCGFELTVPPTVFHPRFYTTSRLLAETLLSIDLELKKVLDVGCGSGILSIAAASRGAQVTAIDANPKAVEATLANAHNNDLSSQVRAIESDVSNCCDMFTGSFDLIVTNPPYYPREPLGAADLAFSGGSDHAFMYNFAAAASRLLSPDGRVLLVLSSDIDQDSAIRPLVHGGFVPTVIRRHRRVFETFSVIQFRKPLTEV